MAPPEVRLKLLQTTATSLREELADVEGVGRGRARRVRDAADERDGGGIAGRQGAVARHSGNAWCRCGWAPWGSVLASAVEDGRVAELGELDRPGRCRRASATLLSVGRCVGLASTP
jgi:hypothetical protein